MFVQGAMLAARVLGPKIAQFTPTALEWTAKNIPKFGPQIAKWMGAAAEVVKHSPNLIHFAASTGYGLFQGKSVLESGLEGAGWALGGKFGAGVLGKFLGTTSMKQIAHTPLALAAR